jgi:hypothetical protein
LTRWVRLALTVWLRWGFLAMLLAPDLGYWINTIIPWVVECLQIRRPWRLGWGALGGRGCK